MMTTFLSNTILFLFTVVMPMSMPMSMSMPMPASKTFDSKLPPFEIIDSIPRRSVITAAVAALLCNTSPPASAASTTVPATANLQCLKDLPPLANNEVRLFLSRHGETESNRLGSWRTTDDAQELNPIGELQAARLGQALALSDEHPHLFFHSPLQRARQTTIVAAAQYHFAADYYGYGTKRETVRVLHDLREIHMGSTAPADGDGNGGRTSIGPPSTVSSTYAAWAAGDIDRRQSPDGESMREILQRVSSALFHLQRAAAESPDRSVVAVSHSSFLRVLLATCCQEDLSEASRMVRLVNCGIDVLDLPVGFRWGGTARRIVSSSPLFGGPLSRAPVKYSLRVPCSTMARANEQRHLVGVQQVDCTIPYIDS